MIGWFQRKVERQMTTQIIGSLVRALLAFAGGTIVVSEEQTEQVIGALAVLASVAWSVWTKYQAQRESREAVLPR